MNRPVGSKIRIGMERDLLTARQAVREASISMGFGIVDQTRLITAVSELTRNAYTYAGEGQLTLEEIEDNGRVGLRVTVSDRGPGIPDIDLAMSDGYSTSGGLGNGLGGSRRLVDQFDIRSKVGEGTTIVAFKWLP